MDLVVALFGRGLAGAVVLMGGQPFDPRHHRLRDERRGGGATKERSHKKASILPSTSLDRDDGDEKKRKRRTTRKKRLDGALRTRTIFVLLCQLPNGKRRGKNEWLALKGGKIFLSFSFNSNLQCPVLMVDKQQGCRRQDDEFEKEEKAVQDWIGLERERERERHQSREKKPLCCKQVTKSDADDDAQEGQDRQVCRRLHHRRRSRQERERLRGTIYYFKEKAKDFLSYSLPLLRAQINIERIQFREVETFFFPPPPLLSSSQRREEGGPRLEWVLSLFRQVKTANSGSSWVERGVWQCLERR